MRSLLRPFLDAFAESLAYTQVSTTIAGADWMVSKADQQSAGLIPPPVEPGFPGAPPPSSEPPSLFERFFDGDADSEIRFPKLEAAAQSLIERRVMPRPMFDLLTDRAKAEAFTVAGHIEDDTIETIQQTLSENLAQGTSLKGFRDSMGSNLETSFLGDGHAETVYRTNIQAAFRDGRETIMANPIVDALFPYQEYIHIGDDRVRSEHALLSVLGIDGTGVYRRDDPFWDYFTPPWDFNCRCAVNVLTKEAAARKGVKEAQEWVRTGEPPRQPEFRLRFIPFPPKDGFGQRGSALSAA